MYLDAENVPKEPTFHDVDHQQALQMYAASHPLTCLIIREVRREGGYERGRRREEKRGEERRREEMISPFVLTHGLSLYLPLPLPLYLSLPLKVLNVFRVTVSEVQSEARVSVLTLLNDLVYKHSCDVR